MNDLSIIIVNYKCWDKLAQCLDSLTVIPETNFSFEVIVVDNASNDGKLLDFKTLYPKFNFISNSVNKDYTDVNSLGAENARGKYLLFLNPEAFVSENVLQGMLEQAKISKVDSIISCQQIKENVIEDKPIEVLSSKWTFAGWSRVLARLLSLSPSQNKRFVLPDWQSWSVILMSKTSFNTTIKLAHSGINSHSDSILSNKKGSEEPYGSYFWF